MRTTFRSLFLLAVVVCSIAPRPARGDGWSQPPGAMRVTVYGAFLTAARQYTETGSSTRLFYDGVFSMYTLGASLEYGLSREVTLLGELPVSHIEFTANDSLHSFTRVLTSPCFFGVGTRFHLFTVGTTTAALSNVLHIPPGFHSGIYDSTHPFLSDGFFEDIIGIEGATRASWGWVEGGVFMHARDEEPADQLELRASLGVDTREGAMMKITVDGVRSLAPIPDTPLDVEKTITVENYVWLEGQILFRLASGQRIGGSAGFRVWGQHTPSLNGVTLTVIF